VSARIGVVTFPGTLDDRDAARAVRIAVGEPVELWHADDDILGVDAVILGEELLREKSTNVADTFTKWII
jgi:phosphoribosylformylglycinamidine (FGAM) synthase-like amidotransferase family enzyme